MFDFHTNTNGQGSDDESNTLSDGLLNTTTSMASSSERYGRLWRRSITVGILITVKKTSNVPGEDPLQSPTSSSPLLNHDTQPNSSQQETSDANNPVQENGLFNFVSKAYSSFSSSKSFKDQETSAPSYDPVPSFPVDEGLVSDLSIRSQHVIDIPSVNESEEQQLRNTVVQIVEERDLNSLKNFGGVERAASIFNSHLDRGIECIQDPQVWDTDNPVHAKGFFYFFLKAGNNYTIFLLLVSAGFSFSTEILKNGPKYGWQDGAVILAAVSMIVTFSSVADFRRERKLKKLWKEKNTLEVKVVRSGQQITISNLVPGDIVRLEKGDRVPADGLVVSGDHLVLDGVLNSRIDREQNPFIHSGSKVREGEGNMLVTSVGANTTLGKLLSLRIRDPTKKTLLEAQIEKPNAYIENLSLVVSILIALVAFIRLLFGKYHGDDDGFPELKGNVSVNVLMKIFEGILFKPRGKISILASALTVVVISIQHGMPCVITVSLSYWSDEVKNQAEPQNVSACATMGIVTVMCIDVTGGLVCNDLEVNKFWIGEKDLNNDVDSEIDQALIEALERGIRAPLLVPAISASTTNGSLISWANSRWGMNVELLDQNLYVLGYSKLSSNDNCCGILMKQRGDEEKSMHMHWSGAASTILDMCSHYYDSNGRSRAIKDIKSRFELLIEDMEGSGLSPIAFACRQTEVQEIQEDGLHLLALAGIKYQCPEEIKSVVEAFRCAGVRIKLVSEDKLSAVRAIACELGISESNDLTLEGEQIRDLSITERMQKVDQVTLMGSCLAEDKLLLVQSMQQKDHIVAFVGGSSSTDSPALKEADVGITVAPWCTEMARDSSDIVIWAHGSLSTILKNGRYVYHNIQKFSQLQLTVCISGLLITLITTMILEESPITTLQFFWVNGITCILGGLMMVMELQVEELIVNPPAERTSSLLTKAMCKSVALHVLCQASVLLIFQFKGQVIPGMNQDVRKAMIFSSFTLSQVVNLFYAMNLVKKEVLLSVLRHIWFLSAFVTVMVVQVLVAEYLKSLAGCVRLNWIQWIVCFLLAALPCSIHIAVEFISHSLINRTWSDGLQTVLSSRRRPHHRPYLLCIGIPFSMFLLFFSY
ncbi:hypothetical protein Ddye_015811 [Dipteronia dyeriana]|uniref:Calcium-transporting ATPase n=1 Tax=Dipteronia dyeriana TaxID=168575 RepID=A0AAD9U5N9_9ROSI|nr:hypothetical protein Ddye_015811 [Dipteronia dyeriana]